MFFSPLGVRDIDYELEPVSIIENKHGSSETTYRTSAVEFQVGWMKLEPGEIRTRKTGGKLEILLITEGAVSIGSGHFQRGNSILIPGLLEEYEIKGKSDAELFRVEIP